MRTNFFPITFEFDEYSIRRIDYQDGVLDELRLEHNSTHSFFRHEDHIYVSNKSGDDLGIGEIVTCSLYEDSQITSSLIKHIFFRTYLERNSRVTPTSFYPFQLESTRPADDIIKALLPDELSGRLCYKKHLEVHLRLIHNAGKPQFGFVINHLRKWSFTLSCQEIVNTGFDIVGLDVLYLEHPVGVDGNVMSPVESAIGHVQEVLTDRCLVVTNEGVQEYPLDKLRLKKSSLNIFSFLESYGGARLAEKIRGKIDQEKESFLNLKNIGREIFKMARWFAVVDEEPVFYSNKDGFCFRIDHKQEIQNDRVNIIEPSFIFDPARVQTKSSADLGLIDFGPFDKGNFSITHPKILAICTKETRGYFTSFLKLFIDGDPDSSYFKKGFKGKYHLHGVDFTVVEVLDFGLDNYDKIIRSLDDGLPDIVIAEIGEQCRAWPVTDNPYYYVKAKFFSLGVPVQFISTQKIRNCNQYILNAVALQCYAKLGGIPYVLQSDYSVDRELIVGLGHTTIRNNTYQGNDQNRVVGITTIFSGDGQYLLANKSKDVSYEEYFNELLTTLRTTINSLIDSQAWEENDNVRIVFHVFKPIKNTEFEVVTQFIKELVRFNVFFAFVTISSKHPYLLFDPAEQGREVRGSKVGEIVPSRKSNLLLKPNECLIQMLGPSEMKTNKHGSSKPLLIRIQLPPNDHLANELEPYLYKDLQYIVQQVYKFTYLSWRGFLKSEEPATVKYSYLIAKLLGKLRYFEFWQPDTVNHLLKHKKWFL